MGGAAAMQSPPGLKGIHLSMKSGMIAAEAAIQAVEKGDFSQETLNRYPQRFEESWAKKEMYEGRNFAQALSKTGLVKFIHLAAQYLTEGEGVRDRLPISEDCGTLRPASEEGQRTEPDKKAVDGVLHLDKLTGVYLSKTMHREDQPSHIILHDQEVCGGECHQVYKNPCTRFCPGKVYEIETDEETPRLKLNPSNCLHCKTCDIKDPYRNITWTCPEGGEGPGYVMA